jgi:hypothetical protein
MTDRPDYVSYAKCMEEIKRRQRAITMWQTKLIRLLNNHVVSFPDNKIVLYVGMQSAETGNVHTAIFQKMD